MKSNTQSICYILIAGGLFISTLFLQACTCKNFTCPDEIPRTADGIGIAFSEDTLSGDGFFVGELKEIRIIKTSKTSPIEYLDTIMPSGGVTRVVSLVIGPNTFLEPDTWTDFDYIIENDDPAVLHTISDIKVGGELEEGTCCEMYINTEKEYLWDGQLVANPFFVPIVLR